MSNPKKKSKTARGSNPLPWVLGGLGAAALVALIVYAVWSSSRPLPGKSVPIQEGIHIAPGAAHEAYNTDPPTSGPHYDSPAQPGFYGQAPADEELVHNLEHGYVIIWYNCARLQGQTCDQLKGRIQELMASAGGVPPAGGNKLIAVPRSSIAYPVVATSWGRIYELSRFDPGELMTFIKAFRNRAPEPNAQ